MADQPENPFDKVLRLISEGASVVQACKAEGTPARSEVYKKLDADSDYADRYARACEIRADAMFDEIFEIADDASNDWMERKGEDAPEGWQLNGDHVQRSKLRIDARKWALAKMQPKKYGDRMEFGGAIAHSVTVQDNFKDE